MTFKEPFCACLVEKVSLTLRMRNMWSFLSYLGEAQLLSRSCYFGLSAHRGPTPGARPGTHLSPASPLAPASCLQVQASFLGPHAPQHRRSYGHSTPSLHMDLSRHPRLRDQVCTKPSACTLQPHPSRPPKNQMRRLKTALNINEL